MPAPLISIILPTKNSLPHLKNAIEGIRRQTYKNFELIIQDGNSTDGTLEYLFSIRDSFKIDIRSQSDNGIGQAYNRGIARSTGNYLFLAASDERLFDDTLKKLLSWFCEHPSAACIYGGVSLVNQQGIELSKFFPPDFDLNKFIKCELTPSFAGLFNKEVIGPDLFYDESLKTCPDYDFWIRLGIRFSTKELICKQELLMASFMDRTSMSYRVESFQQFCKDKQFIIGRFLDHAGPSLQRLGDLKKLLLQAKAGIFTWAAKEVTNIEGLSSNAINFHQEASTILNILDSPPTTAQPLPIGLTMHSFFPSTNIISRFVIGLKKFCKIFSRQALGQWEGGENPWGYTVQACIPKSIVFDNHSSYWIKIRIKVFSGVVGICYLNKNELKEERYLTTNSETVITYYPIHNIEDFSIIFRNGGIKKSAFKIYELSIVQANSKKS